MKKSFFTSLVFLFSLSSLFVNGQMPNQAGLIANNSITIVDRTVIPIDDADPVGYAKRVLFEAIESTGGLIEHVQHPTQTDCKTYLVLGTTNNAFVRRLVSAEPEIDINKVEGVFYQWRKTDTGTALVAGGTDSKGFMYALTELAQQIKEKGLVALTEIKNTVEYPDNTIRGLDKFLTNQHDDSWFFSEDYWQYYIRQLAENRFNRLTLITGYNDGLKGDFMIPVYPYLLKVPGFEGVTLKNNYEKTPEEYLRQLRIIGQLCHQHGLEFVFGIWGHGRSEELVTGLPESPVEYTEYCSLGMMELLRRVPEIDGIQLRVNYESGVGGFGDTAENFWKEIIAAIGKSYHERKGKLTLDIRAKGLTEKMSEWALQTGINLNVTSKYSWEGVGLPYHPTQMRARELTRLDNVDLRQRYGYADFLRKSRDFDFIYRLWGIGTNRIVTWADPDYVKQFSNSVGFGGARGFQVTPPMARKTNTWNLLSNDKLIYYTWEDERYWAWYLLYGRLGYSKYTDEQVWHRAFRQHYGKSFETVLEAYKAASKVLPLITSSHLTQHPANYNWAEMDDGGALFVSHNANPFLAQKERTYQSAEPGDPGLFYSIDEYVTDVLHEDVKPKISPVQLAALYERFSDQTLHALNQVKLDDIPDEHRIEYTTNESDLEMMAALAAYHSLKTKAATDFVIFQATQNKGYLKSSLVNMKTARDEWTKIVTLTSEIYCREPLFLHDNGTWNDRLVEIEKDISQLNEMLGDSQQVVAVSHWDQYNQIDCLPSANFEAVVPQTADKNEPLRVMLKTVQPLKGRQIPKVHYRIANMTAGKFNEFAMEWDGTQYVADIPLNKLDLDYDLLVYFSSMSSEGLVSLFPGLYNHANQAPYYTIKLE